MMQEQSRLRLDGNLKLIDSYKKLIQQQNDYYNYDKNLKTVYHINNNRYYNLYKNTVLNEISSEYPYLSDACNKQLQGRVVAKVVK